MGVLFASKEGPLIMLKSMIVIAFIVVAAVALPSFNDEVVPEEELVGATCTCCGKTVPKPSCSITLYQHCNYGGYGINLAPGSYNMNTLIAKGMKNDDLSSVRIHGSCRAILYQHINFGGASMTKDSDDSCFTNDRMAIPVSQLHQLVVTERPKMPEDEENEDDEVDEVDTNGRRLLGRRAVSWNDQISSAKVQDRQAAAHSCTAVCKAPCAQEKAEKAAAAEKAAKAAEKKKKAEEKASKEAAAKKEKSEKEKASKEKAAKKKEKDAKEKAAKAKAEKDAKEKAAKAKAEKDKKEKDAKKEAAEKAKEKAAKAAEKKAKAAAEAADKKKKEQAEKEKAAKKAAAEKEKAAKASEKAEKKKEKEQKATEEKSKIPPADPCKKYKAQEAANKKLTKTLQKSIRFEPNQTILTAAGKKTLDDVAAVVIKYAWMELDLTGQSTASGSGCQRLVDGRAKAASAYLKNKGCTNKMNTAGKCKTFIGLTIQAPGSAKSPKGC